MKNEFDPKKHEYRIDGRLVPSVTQVLNDVLPQWKAGEWHLQRGRAIHAAVAMLLRGQKFECDPRIEGPVNAARQFIQDFEPKDQHIEVPMFSQKYQFSGTPDFCGTIIRTNVDGSYQRPCCVIDWKSSVIPTIYHQLGAYSILWECNYGFGVALDENGHYQISSVLNLKWCRQEFLALLTAYNIRKRLKISQGEQDVHTDD